MLLIYTDNMQLDSITKIYHATRFKQFYLNFLIYIRFSSYNGISINSVQIIMSHIYSWERIF